MPTVFTHAIVPLVLGAACERRLVSWRLAAAGAISGALPDADVLSLQFDVARDTLLAHRGWTHSIGFACLLGALAALAAPRLRARPAVAFAVIAAAVLSHPLLDMLTNGGSGVALWWPFSSERVSFEWQPVLVSPISIEGFLTAYGWKVVLSELRWILLPCLALAMAIRLGRRIRAAT